MNVTAVEKSSGKENKITITNDSGRLSKEDIERMVNEGEKYKEEDELHKQKVEAKNALENYIYSLKNTLNDEKVKDKFEEEDREMLETKTEELLTWLENNPESETEEYKEKLKELEGVANPIMQKMYSSGSTPGGMPGMPPGGMPPGGMPPGGMPAEESTDPVIDELD